MKTPSGILPVDLQTALSQIGDKLADGDLGSNSLSEVPDLMAGLPPASMARLDREISDTAQLYRWRSMQSKGGILMSAETRIYDTEQLLRTPGLAYLFIFHRDGYLREAALRRISAGLGSPFWFAAVVWRLNDWAGPVRAAAAECARRCFPATRPEIIAQAAIALLLRQMSWAGRGVERDLFDEAYNRVDVAICLADLFIEGRTGPLATTLRYMLRTASIDCHLERIARHAVQPSVRAVALDALINRRAEYPEGYAWQWIDKSMGLRRRVTQFNHRVFGVDVPRDDLILTGIRDRSAAVRRTALDGIMRHLLGTRTGQDYAALAVNDRSPSVRERAKFILRPR